MRFIFGIGNPGNRYKYNRHNAGFLFLDFFAALFSINFTAAKGDYYSAKGSIADNNFMLVKPVTYVNNSGLAAKNLVDKYNINLQDFVVICDDVNLKLGTQRVRLSGGDGGHNGLRSIIYHLKSNQFPRIRIGVGNNSAGSELADYVLSDFEHEDLEELNKVFECTSSLIKEFIIGGSKKMLEENSRINKSDSEENLSSGLNGN